MIPLRPVLSRPMCARGVDGHPDLPETEALLESERHIVFEPHELRIRAVQRARAALPRNFRLQPVARSTRPPRVRPHQLAAALLLLSGLCAAAAFYAGYLSSSGHPETNSADR